MNIFENKSGGGTSPRAALSPPDKSQTRVLTACRVLYKFIIMFARFNLHHHAAGRTSIERESHYKYIYIIIIIYDRNDNVKYIFRRESDVLYSLFVVRGIRNIRYYRVIFIYSFLFFHFSLTLSLSLCLIVARETQWRSRSKGIAPANWPRRHGRALLENPSSESTPPPSPRSNRTAGRPDETTPKLCAPFFFFFRFRFLFIFS